MSDHTDHWRRMGKHFGYPDCCIESFIQRASCMLDTGLRIELTHAQERVHNHTGFIPCDTCSREVLSGEKKLCELIDEDSRTCPYKFPTDEMDMGENI